MSGHCFATVDDLVNTIEREYATIVLLNRCEIGSPLIVILRKGAFTFPIVAMTNGAANLIFMLTEVFSLLRVCRKGAGGSKPVGWPPAHVRFLT